jgi:hypothetical protein
MPKTYQLQSSFNNGVLDETMRARLDTQQYFQGVEQADNIKFIPQGGARRREGFKFIAALDGVCRIIPLVMSSDQRYVLAFTNNKISVLRADTDIMVDTIVTTYTQAQLFELDFAQSGDDMLLTHPLHVPRIITRGATDSDFTIVDVAFTNDSIPENDFNDSQSPTAVSEIQRLTFSGSFATGAGYKLNLESIDTETLTYSDNSSHADDIRDVLLDLVNTPDTGITVVRASPNVFDVTFAGTAAKNWRQMSGRRIDGGSGSVAVTTTQDGSPRTEPVWSNTRGWPKTCTFHEGRLWFGGSLALPTTVWGSFVNSYFNFAFGRSRDDQGIQYSLQTDQNNKITAIYSSTTLQVFTTGGEFVVFQNEFDPITPANIRILNHTRYGTAAVKPTDIEGSVTFVQRTGKAIREMFTEQGRKFTAPSISYLAPSLIRDPIELDAVRGTSSEDANYIHAVNSDGTMAVFNTLKDQNVSAWSIWNTDGDYTSIAVAFSDLYMVCKRIVNGATVYYLEKGDEDFYTDSSIYNPAVNSNVVTGLTHLEGKTVKVVGDGAVLLDRVVASGQITLERSVVSVRIGLEYDATLKTMPISQDSGAGRNLAQEIRVNKVTLELSNSLGVIVNGNRLPDRRVGDPFDTVPAPFTGRKDTPILGWAKTQQITINHTDPVGMTILGIALEVNG